MEAKISLCMIVKDEAQNLKRCLESVAGAVDEIIVVDTGSTDDTCKIAREMGAQVDFFPWNENFSDARNASLERATGEWILFLDADETLAEESKAALHRLAVDSNVEGYFVKILNYLGNEGWIETCTDMVFRLFRNRAQYRFRGAIHEQIADVILEKNSRAVYRMAEELVIIHYGYLDRHIEEKDKKNRNIKIIEKELAEDPENRLLRYHYGVELYRAGRYGEAAEELTRAANGIDPNTIYLPKLLRYIVMSHQSAGQPEQALEVAAIGHGFFPDYADLYYYAGLLHLELKQYVKAGEAFQKAVNMPAQPAYYASFGGVRGFRSYYHLGQISEIFLNYEEAIKYYMASVQDNSDFLHALEGIIRILKPKEDPEYVKGCLEKFFDFCTPDACQKVGEIFYRHGAYSLALWYFEKNGNGGQISADLQLWKAVSLIQEQRYLEAMRTLERDFPESHHYPLVRFNKLFCYWVQGKRKKTRALFAELQSMGLSEDTEKVLNLMANPPDRRKSNCVVSLGQDGMTLFMDILNRLLYMRETDRAIRFMQGIAPSSLSGHRLTIARSFYDYGYREKAEDLLREYIGETREAEAHFLLAEICREKGSFIETDQHYRYALELNPDDPKFYVRQIDLYDSWRLKILQEAIERYPDIEVFRKMSEEAPAT